MKGNTFHHERNYFAMLKAPNVAENEQSDKSQFSSNFISADQAQIQSVKSNER